MGPASSAASDSAAYFVIAIVRLPDTVRVPSEPPRGFRIVVSLTSAGGLSNPRFAPTRSSTLPRPPSNSTYYLHHTASLYASTADRAIRMERYGMSLS